MKPPRSKILKRFHALAVLEAIGESSEAEKMKLARYQVLLREKPSPIIIQSRARYDWNIRCLKKAFGRLIPRTDP